MDGYFVYLRGEQATADTTSYVVTSMKCGESADLGVSAFDASGNESAKVMITISTAACADTSRPTAPDGFRQVATTRDAVVLAWNPSSDDTGVIGYRVYRDTATIASPAEPNVTVSGLGCGRTYVLSVDAADAAGNRSPLATAYATTASCEVAPAPLSPPAPATCPSGQFRGQYYGNVTLSGTALKVACESKVNYDWGAGGPGSPVSTDAFSARWIGQVDFPAGETTFTVTADDGVRLSVDGTVVVDAWKDQGATAYTARRTLSAGAHEVKLEYYEKTGLAVAKLAWTSAQSAPPPPTPAPPPPPPSSCPSGQFRGQYYGNVTLSGTALKVACESKVDYDWAAGGPGSPVSTDAFSARWIGQVDFPAGETTFTVTADDGVRLSVDGTVVVDAWKDQGATAYTARRTLSAGAHEVKLEYYEKTGLAVAKLAWTSAQSAPPPPTPAPPPPPPSSCPSGQFRGQYYGNVTLSGTALKVACESKVDYDWAAGGPGSPVSTDAFSARWIGQVDFPAGETTFTVTADDGVRLSVDGTVVVDAWKDQGATAYTARRTLSAGAHEVKLEYYEKTGLAVARLGWATGPSTSLDTTSPSQPKNLAISNASGSSVSLMWSPSTDNLGVAGYGTYKDSAHVGGTVQPGANVGSLTCGTAYVFETDAVDVAGNRSTKASVVGSTTVCADSQAPTGPTNVAAISRTATSIALNWSASTDNVGVVGYGLYRGGVQTGTSASATGIFAGLTCNTNYTLAVDAHDAAGNRSSRTSVMVATTPCADTTPPTAPSGLASSNVTQTSLTLSWNAATDNVGVTGYDVYRNGIKTATVTSTSSNQTGLVCGTTYSLGVVVRDAAGNSSPQASLPATTSACSTPPPPSGGPITITQGGTYTGVWVGNGSGPTVRIATSSPVVIENSMVKNTGAASLIDASYPGAQLTVRRTTLEGAPGSVGKAVYGNGFKSVRVENCTINYTWGIRLDAIQAGGTIVVTRNKGRNMQLNTADRSHFFQAANHTQQPALIDVSWNEIVNEFGKSGVEDVINMYGAGYAKIHDNYIQGAYPESIGGGYAGSGIMLDSGAHDNEVWGNIVVDTVNAGIGIASGRNNSVHDNRVVFDGRDDGGNLFAAANIGIYVWNYDANPTWGNNHATRNMVGWVKANGQRNDLWLPDAPSSDYATNSALANPISRATEQSEYQSWLAKLASNGISVGA